MFLHPGGLLQRGESLTISEVAGEAVSIRRFGGDVVFENAHCGGSVTWLPPTAGAYVVSCGARSRYVGVVEAGWAVCQLTVGAFTAEDFDAVVHAAPVPMDYYISLEHAESEIWRTYERRYGDAIHPHVHADSLKSIAPELAHQDPNWDSLSCEQIVAMLRRLQQWWSAQGYRPLDRIATYTPCNKLIAACKIAGIRVLHSLCPEQNWSDGEWAINHWGMPTCPFWAAEDDFRKAGPRSADGVLAITMNHYQVLLPHLTHWGDFVLSPSHTLRWHRSSESGPEPIRFEQFARDTIANAAGNHTHPLFFVAGFEFGRTFGTRNMTDHNRQGLRKLIELSRTTQLVFAASSDVRAYYDRHIVTLPERALVQRDTWAGARTMGKPGVVGDSVVIEHADYKALVREGQALPFFHYDYLAPWHYETAATDVPEDFAAADRDALSVERTARGFEICANAPLPRVIPVVVWDAALKDLPVSTQILGALDDGRTHTLLEFPRGWQGRLSIPLAVTGDAKSARPGFWQTRTFGAGDRRHTYLHLDLPLLHDVEIPIELARAVRVDGPQEPLGLLGPGMVTLRVGPHRTWHRFWGAEAEDLRPTEATLHTIAELKKGTDLLADDWQKELDAHRTALHQATLAHLYWREEDVALEVFCGAKHPLGSRSRAMAYDLVHALVKGLSASEYGDGVLAYGPGKSFWCHPRGLTFKIRGIPAAMRAQPLTVVMHSFDPLKLGARYRIRIAGEVREHWSLPVDPFEASAWHRLEIRPEWINAKGEVAITLLCDQTPVLQDWWKERGFVAGLHALWVHA